MNLVAGHDLLGGKAKRCWKEGGLLGKLLSEKVLLLVLKSGCSVSPEADLRVERTGQLIAFS